MRSVLSVRSGKMALKKAVLIKVIVLTLAALLVVTVLGACDDSGGGVQSAASAQHSTGQQVSLLDDHFTFTLPAGITEQDSQNNGANNHIYAYASADEQQAIIVIVSAASSDTLEAMASRLQLSQQKRDQQLQVISNQQVTISGHPLWRFDSLLAGKTGRLYSSIVFGEIEQKLLIMQVTVPVPDSGDHQLDMAKKQADKVVNSIVVK